MRTWIVAALASSSLIACVKTNAFKCEGEDNRCSGTGARCEADGFCSTPSSACASGFQYSDTAGDLAGTCVGGDTPTDGPVDGTPDAPPDSPTGCNQDFAPITGGNANHKYKLIAVADDWVTQQGAVCATANQGYLAVPDDATELGALFTLAGNVDIWVGVSDRATEGTYLEVQNDTLYNSLPITENGNQMNKDCVGSLDGTTLETEGCNTTRVAVCECNE